MRGLYLVDCRPPLAAVMTLAARIDVGRLLCEFLQRLMCVFRRKSRV